MLRRVNRHLPCNFLIPALIRLTTLHRISDIEIVFFPQYASLLIGPTLGPNQLHTHRNCGQVVSNLVVTPELFALERASAALE